MSLHGQYDPQNIFALILRGDAPCYKIYEDDQVLAFLDIFPQSTGHVLIIPKASRARNILEVEPTVLSAMMSAVQYLTRIIVDELQPDGVQIAQFNGAVAGQTVYHIHMHIIPRWEGLQAGEHGRGKAEAEELRALQARLVARLSAAQDAR